MKYILFTVFTLVSLTSRAQSFDFGCSDEISGEIKITGTPFVAKAFDPNNVDLGNASKFNLTTKGVYTIIVYAIEPVTKKITINQSGNQTIAWSEI